VETSHQDENTQRQKTSQNFQDTHRSETSHLSKDTQRVKTNMTSATLVGRDWGNCGKQQGKK
jgi:hypothetical protein